MASKRKTGKPRAIELHEAAGATCEYRRGRWHVDYPANGSPVASSASVQCRGETRSGERCKLTTTDPSGLCGVHREG